MGRVFADLKHALDEALTATQTLKPSPAEIIPQPGEQAIPFMPVAVAKQTAERLRNAADMGNISELKTIAKELRSDSDTYGNFSDTIDRLAENFDLDGIMKLCDKLEGQTND